MNLKIGAVGIFGMMFVAIVGALLFMPTAELGAIVPLGGLQIEAFTEPLNPAVEVEAIPVFGNIAPSEQRELLGAQLEPYLIFDEYTTAAVAGEGSADALLLPLDGYFAAEAVVGDTEGTINPLIYTPAALDEFAADMERVITEKTQTAVEVQTQLHKRCGGGYGP